MDKALVYRYELRETKAAWATSFPFETKTEAVSTEGTGVLEQVPSLNSAYPTSTLGRGRPIISASASLTIFPSMFNPEERSCSLEGNPVSW